MAKYYAPSGKFDPLAFLYFILIALIALPILGLAYAYALWYIPIIYVNFIIAGAFGFVIAWLVSKLIVGKGKVRNVGLTIALSILAGLIALYFHWAVWVDLVINAGESYGTDRMGITVSNIKILQTFYLALHPSVLFDFIGKINETGTWGIKGSTVSGTFLTVIWVIETLIIVGIAAIIPIAASKKPFCELGNEWFDEKELPAFNFIEDEPQMIKDLESSNPEVFATLTRTNDLENNHSIFSLYTSKHNESYLTIANQVATLNKKDELELEENEFIEYVYLNSELKTSIL